MVIFHLESATVTGEVVGKRFSISPSNGVHLLRTNTNIPLQGYTADSDVDSSATQIANAVKLVNPFVTSSVTGTGINDRILTLDWQTDDEFNINTNFLDASSNQDATVLTTQNTGSIGNIFEVDGTTNITDSLENHKTLVTFTEPNDVNGNSGNSILNNRGYFNAYTDSTLATETTSLNGNSNKIMDRTSNSLITDMRASLTNANTDWTLSNNNTTDIATMRSVNKEHFPDVWTWDINNSTGNGTWTNQAFMESQAGFGIPTYYGLRSTDIINEDITNPTNYAWFNLINTLGVGVDINPSYKQIVPFEPLFDFDSDPVEIGFRAIPANGQFESATTTSSEIQNLPINAPDGTPADGSTIVIVGGQFYIANIVS